MATRRTRELGILDDLLKETTTRLLPDCYQRDKAWKSRNFEPECIVTCNDGPSVRTATGTINAMVDKHELLLSSGPHYRQLARALVAGRTTIKPHETSQL